MPESTIHINRALTNISILYRNTDYIADQVFPTVKVNKDSNNYFIYSSNFLIPETERANKAPANMYSWAVSTGSYSVTEHALKDLVSDRDRRNADSPLQMDVDTTEELTDKIMLRREFNAAAIAFTTTSFGNSTTYTATATQSWKTSTVFPTKDILSATSVIRQASAQRANSGVMGQVAFDTAKENSNILDRIKYTQRAIVTEDILASLWGLKKIVVGGAIYDTNKEGLSVSVSDIWGANMLLAFLAKPSLKTPSALYNFQAGNRITKKWREEERAGDYIEVNETYVMKAPASSSGYLIKSVNL